ncbi:MAG: nucleotidyltransferase family protein [Candidatus Cloacimonetes bacterium]|nr:nucleotidyltransferase family protein [Candidatus Cloacimonadota bacterium]
MALYSIILSAGKSSRMGSDKAFLQIEGKTWLDTIIEKIQPVSAGICLVSGSNHQKLQNHKYNFPVRIVHNTTPELGMFSSLKLAINTLNTASHALIHLIDHPLICPETYLKIVAALDDQHQIFMPALASEKRSGHPIIINRQVMDMIIAAPLSANLHDIIIALPVDKLKRIPVTDRHILDNINTPGQFRSQINS